MKEEQIQDLLFIQELSSHRVELRGKLNNQEEEISSSELTDSFLKIQLLLYQNRNRIDVTEDLEENTNNLMKLINWEHAFGVHANEGDDNRFQVNFEDEISECLDTTNLHKEPSNGHIAHFGKEEKAEPLKIQIREHDIKSFDAKIEEDKKKPAEFISASSLPKGTSVRKKFVPPFKKEKEEGFRMKEPCGDKESDEAMDPRYQNLEGKLVQMIESEIVERDSKVEWSQIAGLGFAKKIIHEMIVWPMLRPDIFTGLRAPPKGILLFGPPGTGKTMIGRAIASEAHATFFSISASSITSKWVGESEKLVKTLFAIARAKQPSVIFIDEIDSLLCSRKEGEQESSRRVKTEFMVELDGAKGNGAEERVLIIGATNLPQELDDAVRRRFVKRLYIPLPNYEGRKQLINTLTDNISFCLSEEEKEKLSDLTKGFSGADMYNLCSESSYVPLRNLSSIETIRSSEVPVTRFEHFIEALRLVRPSVNNELLNGYERWNEQYGSYQLTPDELEKETVQF